MGNKTGKSITQFPRQTSLTGDELFLVNQIQSNASYISRHMTLDALKDYIIEQLENQTNNEGN